MRTPRGCHRHGFLTERWASLALDAQISGALDYTEYDGGFKSRLKEDLVLLRLDETSAARRKSRLFTTLNELGEFSDALSAHSQITKLERPWAGDEETGASTLKYTGEDLIKMYQERQKNKSGE